MTKIYVPCDAAARAVGADRVAHALHQEAMRRGVTLDIVRNGSRGLFWLEPMIEVETPAGRIAYGPVTPSDVSALFDGGLLDGQPIGRLDHAALDDIAGEVER